MDASRELNIAVRFGRMDIALEHTSKSARETFLDRRRKWGNEIRVVDVNLARMELLDEERAEVIVQYAWTRMDDGALHNTVVKQHWENPENTGWRLGREERTEGDVGLFGEHQVRQQTPTEDVHYEVRSLGAISSP